MAKNRDDFSKKTVDALAKRVGYLCSKPDCRRSTVGPHTDVEKATITGTAAHITAAANGGPRYDGSLTPQQRQHIDNGIWLCSYHAVLIDKDEDAFPPPLLKKWKLDAEQERLEALSGNALAARTMGEGPYLEAELQWTSNGKLNRGLLGRRNREKFPDGIIYPGDQPIILWNLVWDFLIVVYNNSEYPAYNITVRQAGEKRFSHIQSLPKINNLPPFANLDIEARYEEYNDGTAVEADKRLEERVPYAITGLIVELVYQGKARREHVTKLTLTGPPDYLANEKVL